MDSLKVFYKKGDEPVLFLPSQGGGLFSFSKNYEQAKLAGRFEQIAPATVVAVLNRTHVAPTLFFAIEKLARAFERFLNAGVVFVDYAASFFLRDREMIVLAPPRSQKEKDNQIAFENKDAIFAVDELCAAENLFLKDLGSSQEGFEKSALVDQPEIDSNERWPCAPCKAAEQASECESVSEEDRFDLDVASLGSQNLTELGLTDPDPSPFESSFPPAPSDADSNVCLKTCLVVVGLAAAVGITAYFSRSLSGWFSSTSENRNPPHSDRWTRPLQGRRSDKIQFEEERLPDNSNRSLSIPPESEGGGGNQSASLSSHHNFQIPQGMKGGSGGANVDYLENTNSSSLKESLLRFYKPGKGSEVTKYPDTQIGHLILYSGGQRPFADQAAGSFDTGFSIPEDMNRGICGADSYYLESVASNSSNSVRPHQKSDHSEVLLQSDSDSKVSGLQDVQVESLKSTGRISSLFQSFLDLVWNRWHTGRPYAGIVLSDVSSNAKQEEFHLKENEGVLVASVVKGSPADIGGVQNGDVIVSLDEEKVQSGGAMGELLLERRPGDEVRLEILRNQKPLCLSIRLGEHSGVKIDQMFNGQSADFGRVEARHIAGNLAKTLGLEQGDGILITDMEKYSPAEKGGLQRGDIIFETNYRPIHSLSNLFGDIASSRPGENIELKVLRGDQCLPLSIVLGKWHGFYGGLTPAQAFMRRPKLGISLKPIDEYWAKESDLGTDRGFFITEVIPFSAASDAGIKEGDVIVRCNQKPVGTPSEFVQELGAMKRGDTIELTVLQERQSKDFSFSLK